MRDRCLGSLGRPAIRRRVVAGATLAGLAGLAGCGGGGGGGSSVPTATPAAAAACLRAAGHQVVNGSPNPQTGAIAQLLTNGAYIAFYRSAAFAAAAEPAIAKTAKALKGSTLQQGTATVDFVGSPLTKAARQGILGCVA